MVWVSWLPCSCTQREIETFGAQMSGIEVARARLRHALQECVKECNEIWSLYVKTSVSMNIWAVWICVSNSITALNRLYRCYCGMHFQFEFPFWIRCGGEVPDPWPGGDGVTSGWPVWVWSRCYSSELVAFEFSRAAFEFDRSICVPRVFNLSRRRTQLAVWQLHLACVCFFFPRSSAVFVRAGEFAGPPRNILCFSSFAWAARRRGPIDVLKPLETVVGRKTAVHPYFPYGPYRIDVRDYVLGFGRPRAGRSAAGWLSGTSAG